MNDPDQLSTELLRLLQSGAKETINGVIVASKDRTLLEELVSEGLADRIDKTDEGFEALLNGKGIAILKII